MGKKFVQQFDEEFVATGTWKAWSDKQTHEKTGPMFGDSQLVYTTQTKTMDHKKGPRISLVKTTGEVIFA